MAPARFIIFSSEPAHSRPDVRNARSSPFELALSHPNVGDAIWRLPHNPGRTAGQQVTNGMGQYSRALLSPFPTISTTLLGYIFSAGAFMWRGDAQKQ